MANAPNPQATNICIGGTLQETLSDGTVLDAPIPFIKGDDGANGLTPFISTSPPENPAISQDWINPLDNSIQEWNGSAWISKGKFQGTQIEIAIGALPDPKTGSQEVAVLDAPQLPDSLNQLYIKNNGAYIPICNVTALAMQIKDIHNQLVSLFSCYSPLRQQFNYQIITDGATNNGVVIANTTILNSFWTGRNGVVALTQKGTVWLLGRGAAIDNHAGNETYEWATLLPYSVYCYNLGGKTYNSFFLGKQTSKETNYKVVTMGASVGSLDADSLLTNNYLSGALGTVADGISDPLDIDGDHVLETQWIPKGQNNAGGIFSVQCEGYFYSTANGSTTACKKGDTFTFGNYPNSLVIIYLKNPATNMVYMIVLAWYIDLDGTAQSYDDSVKLGTPYTDFYAIVKNLNTDQWPFGT